MDVALVCSVDSPLAAELVSLGLFEHGALGVAEESLGGQVVLIAGFSSTQRARRAPEAVADLADTTIEEVERAWPIEQRAFLTSTTAGPFRVRAPWHASMADDRIELVIDPGAAFGHGGHPSTQLALGVLTDLVHPRDRVVDVGAGTGVLSVAAARLGAMVTALEIDAEAAELTEKNARANGVAQQIDVRATDATFHDFAGADVALVNVAIDVHRVLATRLARVPRLVLSGILADQVSELLTLHTTDCTPSVRTSGEWAVVLVDRSEGAVGEEE